MTVTDSPTPTLPPLVEHTVLGRTDDEPLTFAGRLLGAASSREPTDEHRHAGDHAPPRWRCRACRWFEVGVYRLPDETYLVHTRGMTLVPGEVTFGRVAYAGTPFRVLELLTEWRRGPATLPDVSLNALEKAARFDDGLRDALDRWLDAGA